MKALELNLPVIVCINKIDRPEARPEEVIDEVLELFMDLDASDEQLDCPFIFASARDGYAIRNLNDEHKDMTPLFETIIDYIPAPTGDPDANTQVLISTIDYNEYVGRIGVGKVDNGVLKVNQDAIVVNHHEPDKQKKVKISKLYEFDGLNKVEVKEAKIGSIVAISGIADIHIGDTICATDNPVAIPFQKISEPTLSMNFMVNDSPLAGQEGKFITSRHLRDRLFRELNTDVSLRVEETDSADCFKVSGRGELHLSVLIENMRREGYEFQVSKPEVIFKTVNGEHCEPYENLIVDVPEAYAGSTIERLAGRKAEMKDMMTSNGRTNLTFHIPARGLIGFRSEFIRMTRGEGIMYHTFLHYRPFAGDIPRQRNGSIIAHEQGEAIPYALAQYEDRGTFFVTPKTKVYRGMIIGECNKPQDIVVNICKTKKLTNMRSATADVMVTLQAHKEMSLEECMEYIAEDELVEITPENVRIRKSDLNKKIYN